MQKIAKLCLRSPQTIAVYHTITHKQDFTLLRDSWGDEWSVPDEGYIHIAK